MTNLFEKSLITGFGIFVLIIFITFITPFYDEVEEFNEEEKDDIDNYMDFVEQLDNAILTVRENPGFIYNDDIQCYENLEVIIEEKQVKIYFKLDNHPYYKILEYDVYLCNYTYDYLVSEIYNLEILYLNNNSYIKVVFSR